jgi:branched-chain amino acid transport system permease protein
MISQLLANGLLSGSIYALTGLGFGLIYGTTRIFHFSHGAIYVLSSYLFYSIYVQAGVPLGLSFFLTVSISAALGSMLDRFVYVPFVKAGASSRILMLSSIGLYIVIVNVIAVIYGNETKIIEHGLRATYRIENVILSQIQVIGGIVFIIILAILIIILNKTELGKLVRAMRDDPLLVSTLGINPGRIRFFVFALGSSLAAVASVLAAMDIGIDPYRGMPAFLNGAVAVFIGGIGIFEGAAIGGLVLGILQGLTIWKANSMWQEPITFIVLLGFLLFRPQGLFGRRRRTEETVL